MFIESDIVPPVEKTEVELRSTKELTNNEKLPHASIFVEEQRSKKAPSVMDDGRIFEDDGQNAAMRTPAEMMQIGCDGDSRPVSIYSRHTSEQIISGESVCFFLSVSSSLFNQKLETRF